MVRPDRLMLFDFHGEPSPGAKIGLADYLSRNPSSEAKSVSTFDSLLTVAIITSIRGVLEF